MARPLENFRKMVRGALDGLADETADLGRQIRKHAKAGVAAHFTTEFALGLSGEITEDSEGGWDFRVRATTPLPVGGGALSPEGGMSSGTSGRFLGPGQAHLMVRMVVVNAQALEAGVNAGTGGGDVDDVNPPTEG